MAQNPGIVAQNSEIVTNITQNRRKIVTQTLIIRSNLGDGVPSTLCPTTVLKYFERGGGIKFGFSGTRLHKIVTQFLTLKSN